MPRWEFWDVKGNYAPVGKYEISLIIPDKLEYAVNGETIVNDNPKGLVINSNVKLVKYLK